MAMSNRIPKNTLISSGVAPSSIPAVCKAYAFVKCASSKKSLSGKHFVKYSSGCRGGDPCAWMGKQSVPIGVKFFLIHLTWRFFLCAGSGGASSSLLLCSGVLSFATDGG